MGDQQTSPTTTYRYAIKYFIVDEFGELLFVGRVTLAQDNPRPQDEVEAAAFDARNTCRSIRAACDRDGFPAGRILIAAVFPAAL